MLDSLHIKNFRCFEDLTIPSLGRVNLIVGKNNSGKSTLLEAVYLFAKRGEPQAIVSILEKRNELHTQESAIRNFNQIEKIFNGSPNEDLALYIGNTTNYILIDSFKEKEYLVNNKKSKNGLDLTVKMSDSSAATLYPLDYEYFDKEELENDDMMTGYPNALVNSQIEDEDKLSYLWDSIATTSDDIIIIKALKIIAPEINNIIFIKPTEKSQNRIAMIKTDKEIQASPIKSMGEGASRILQIFLHALQARKGYLMIDEFENGLHYSIQEEVWEKLFKLAKELDIQVFATTHSEDTVKAFCKVSLHSPEEGHLISLGRSAYGEDKGKIIAIVHDENDLQYILDTGMEVR
jgi:AAA15 family ATPase/GTPase